jgi:shikimate kinase
MNIVLFGFKGCGKTYYGKLASIAFQCPFIDTDDLIVSLYGENIPIRTLYQRLGERAFRELETQAIQQMHPLSPAVIAVGGGAILHPANVVHLQTMGHLVYLKVDFLTAMERILKQGIPSFANAKKPIASLQEIYITRVPIYESIPAQWIDVDRLNDREVLNKLKEIYGF